MNLLLSIKPEFAEKIFDGTKRYEFRRTIFKRQDINKVIVYASSPVQKVIGEFEIAAILQCEIKELWKRTRHQSGISEDYFLNYFSDRHSGFAIKIKNAARYKTQYCIHKHFGICPPQSYAYVDKTE